MFVVRPPLDSGQRIFFVGREMSQTRHFFVGKTIKVKMKQKIKIDTIILDFDSTILDGELLEMIAQIVFCDDPLREEKVLKIAKITSMGMEGKISFEESLKRRLALLDLDERHIDECVKITRQKINPDYLSAINFLKNYRLFVVSGGYKNIIDRVDDLICIDKDNIFANQLVFDGGRFAGIDTQNPLSRSDGKSIVAARVGAGKTLMIGDGMTDAKVFLDGAADYFAVYTGIVRRSSVVDLADFEISSFSQLEEIFE